MFVFLKWFLGKVVLENLVLKRDAVSALDIPVVMVHGNIGTVNVTVPWSNLKTEPMLVEIRDVHVVCRPRADHAVDADAVKRMQQQRKLERLAKHEQMIESVASSGESEEENDADTDSAVAQDAAAAQQESFYSALLTKIIDNVQVSIDNVHLRYEDDQSRPESPFACGVVVQRLSAHSCDSNWLQAFVADHSKLVRKRVSLQHCAVYWQSDAELFVDGHRTATQVGELLNACVQNTQQSPLSPRSFIVAPVQASLKVFIYLF